MTPLEGLWQEFNEDGYAVIGHVLNGKQLQHLRQRIEDLKVESRRCLPHKDPDE